MSKLAALQKAMVVARFEFFATVTRRSALIVMFGLPLVVVGLGLLLNRFAAPAGDSSDPFAQVMGMVSGIVGGEAEEPPAGVVDYTGTLTALEAEFLVLYPDEEAVRTAYAAGEINSYYVIPAGYIEGEEVRHYAESLADMRQPAERSIIYNHLVASLLEDPALVARTINTANIQGTNISPETTRGDDDVGDEDFSDNLLGGMAVFMLFFLTTMGASGYLLQSLGKEKQNRVMEILLSSVRPSELLAGKVLGLGLFGMLQLVVWGLVVLLFFGRSGDNLFQFLPIPDLALSDWFGIALFFIAGYFVYASLYAGLGALAPNPKEGGQYAFFIILPVLIPIWFNTIFFTAPNSLFPTILSLIPFSAPVAMPMRITATVVPLWQIGLSLLLTTLTAVGIIMLVSRFFRSTTLLSGSSLSVRYIWQSVKGS